MSLSGIGNFFSKFTTKAKSAPRKSKPEGSENKHISNPAPQPPPVKEAVRYITDKSEYSRTISQNRTVLLLYLAGENEEIDKVVAEYIEQSTRLAGGYDITAILDIAKHPEAQNKIKLEDAPAFEFFEGGRNLATVLKADAEKVRGFLERWG